MTCCVVKKVNKKVTGSGCAAYFILWIFASYLIEKVLKKFCFEQYTTIITFLLFFGVPIVFTIFKPKKKYNVGVYDIKHELYVIDCLNGREFESWCGSLLEKLQYTNIKLTPASGDQGADIIATHEGLRYVIQCKHYSSNVGNKPVQEVLSARRIYECDEMMVMTNSHFTPGGKEAARANNVKLIDREGLIQMMSIANELFIRSEKATNRAIRKGKRLAKKKVKKEYSEEQLIEYKDHLDNLPHWKMVGENEIVEE